MKKYFFIYLKDEEYHDNYFIGIMEDKIIVTWNFTKEGTSFDKKF